MDQYKNMCIKAGLNYYNKYPTMNDLQEMSGFDTETFKEKIKLSRKLMKMMLQPMIVADGLTEEEIKELDEFLLEQASDEMLAVCIVMGTKGLTWNNETWISTEEYLESL